MPAELICEAQKTEIKPQRNHSNSKANTNTTIQPTGNSVVNLRLAPLVIR